MKEISFSNAILLPEIVRLINEGHTVTLRLKGFSMRPFLEDGRDKALLTLPKNPKLGDPVLAENFPRTLRAPSHREDRRRPSDASGRRQSGLRALSTEGYQGRRNRLLSQGA